MPYNSDTWNMVLIHLIVQHLILMNNIVDDAKANVAVDPDGQEINKRSLMSFDCIKAGCDFISVKKKKKKAKAG